jgi:hypothetical protein
MPDGLPILRPVEHLADRSAVHGADVTGGDHLFGDAAGTHFLAVATGQMRLLFGEEAKAIWIWN